MIELVKKHLLLIILLIFTSVVFYRGLVFLDPDFGWHFREGGLILQSGIPKTDPFSYSMPSFAVIDHEWFSNVLIFIIFDFFGQHVLAFLYAAIYFLALFFSIPQKYKNYASIPLVLGGALIANFAGVRLQVETWFFLAVLLKIIFDEGLWQKWRYLIPVIFLPWVNLHGGFVIGIVILFVLFFAKSVELKKIAFSDFKIFLASIFVTFINPYGPRIWYEIWQTASDPLLSLRIAEWAPAVFNVDVAMMVLFAVSTVFIFTYRKKFMLYELSIYSFLSLMAILHLRNIPLWAVGVILLTPKAFFYFYEQINERKERRLRLEKIKKILAVVFFLIFAYEISLVVIFSHNFDRYPKNAVAFLKMQKIKGNLFATYDVGGYLIWKFPEKKVFIDGRMPSWRREGVFPNESNNAFEDYTKMLENEDFFKKELKKYNVRYVLLPKPENKKRDWLTKKLIFIENIFPPQVIDNHILSVDLKNFGMTKIYDDGNYVIYKM